MRLRRPSQQVLGGALLLGALGGGSAAARPTAASEPPSSTAPSATSEAGAPEATSTEDTPRSEPLPRRLRRLGSCTEAGLADLSFLRAVAIDEIRVLVAPRDPSVAAAASGALRVEITAGGNLRRLMASAHGASGLRFSPALRGDKVRVALDPDFARALDSCMVRIDLYYAGQLVTSVYP